jgi:iron complex transport system substrate-binding protein
VNPLPRRIACLAPELPAILDRLGVLDRVVAVSGFSREPVAVHGLPRIGGFSTPDLERVTLLRPDLAICSTDVQADAAAALLRRGVPVLGLSPASFAEVTAGIRLVGAAVGARRAADRLAAQMERRLSDARRRSRDRSRRPRVWFEEWPEPLVAAIGWVWDLVVAAGGQPIAPAEVAARERRADGRRVDPAAVAAADPDLILAAWCGRRVRLGQISGRPGWAETSAVRHGKVVAVPDADFLQPGPQLLRGLERLEELFAPWA